MNPEKDTSEKQIEEFSLDGATSLEDFIKELEAKEKDLDISSNLIVEIEESDEAEMPDTLELLGFLEADSKNGSTNGNGSTPPVERLASQSELPNGNVLRLEGEVERLRRQVSKFETERLEVAEAARRRQYDFDNYRKRTERERSEMLRNVLTNVATEILPVLDNLTRALESASALSGEKSKDFQQFVDGVILVNQQLNEVLEEMGIQPIISVGEPFDPHFHEAVAAEQNDALPPHTVIAEILRGYRIDDKVVRHSLVKVSTNSNSTVAATTAVVE